MAPVAMTQNMAYQLEIIQRRSEAKARIGNEQIRHEPSAQQTVHGQNDTGRQGEGEDNGRIIRRLEGKLGHPYRSVA